MMRSIRAKTFVLYALAILLTGVSVYIVVRKIDETSRRAEHTSASVADLTKAVAELKGDNGQQTVILCTLILGQNVSITGDDAAKIEAICKEKIRQTNEDTTPVNPTSISSQSQDNLTSSSNDTPLGVPVQPETPQPAPQSLLPGVTEPLVGCVTKGICI